MRPREVNDNIGKEVTINSDRDLWMCECRREIIGKTCILVKQCKNGLLQVSYGKKLFSLAMRNVDAVGVMNENS